MQNCKLSQSLKCVNLTRLRKNLKNYTFGNLKAIQVELKNLKLANTRAVNLFYG